MKARILWVEGKRASSPSFIPSVRKKDCQVEIVSTGSAALELLLVYDPDLVVINAASLHTSGKKICHDLRQSAEKLPIVVIANPEQSVPDDNCVNVVLRLPFTARKLLNRIVPLLPSDEHHLLHVGPIRLDLEHHKLRCQGREAQLTPRLTSLLRVLMEHPGEVQQRDKLFQQVWSTEYTGDTRTLDVHISWLRKKLEENPKKPQFLKTIRGLGYRLDI